MHNPDHRDGVRVCGDNDEEQADNKLRRGKVGPVARKLPEEQRAASKDQKAVVNATLSTRAGLWPRVIGQPCFWTSDKWSPPWDAPLGS